ncbi:MAG: MFS transporter, partial [Chloroflexi bacterium]|nr:MFS transporter [Chloroflexota bacterium]
SGLAMGVVGILQTLPDLLFGLPAGAFADRWDRRRMMLFADLGRAALTALIPLSVIVGWDTMTVILLVTAPIHLLRVIFMAAFTAAVPALAGREHLGQANGIVESVYSFSFIVGPAIAGILSGLIGPAPTLAIDALSFLGSAGALFLVRRTLQAPSTGPRETHLLQEIRDGIAFIWQEQTLRMVVAYWGAVSVVTAPLVSAVIFFLTADRSQDAGIVGTVVSAYGLGYLAGAVLGGRFARGRLGLFMIGGNLAFAASLVLFAWATSLPLWLVGSFLTGASGALVLVSYVTLRAAIPPDALLGRVGSTARTISIGLSPIGMLVGGLLLDRIGGSRTVLVIAAIIVAVTALSALSRTLRAAAAPPRAPSPGLADGG